MNDLYTYMNQIQFEVAEKSSDSGMDKPAVLPTTESHIWGRILELGKITIEVSLVVKFYITSDFLRGLLLRCMVVQ